MHFSLCADFFTPDARLKAHFTVFCSLYPFIPGRVSVIGRGRPEYRVGAARAHQGPIRGIWAPWGHHGGEKGLKQADFARPADHLPPITFIPASAPRPGSPRPRSEPRHSPRPNPAPNVAKSAVGDTFTPISGPQADPTRNPSCNLRGGTCTESLGPHYPPGIRICDKIHNRVSKKRAPGVSRGLLSG